MTLALTYAQRRALRAVSDRAPYADTIAIRARREAIAELVALGLLAPSYPLDGDTHWPRKLNPLTRLGQAVLEELDRERNGSSVTTVELRGTQ